MPDHPEKSGFTRILRIKPAKLSPGRNLWVTKKKTNGMLVLTIFNEN